MAKPNIRKILAYTIFPVHLGVRGDEAEYAVRVKIDCPLCKESDEWPFPAVRRNHFGHHFWLGLTYKPEKGNAMYDLHKKLNYHLYDLPHFPHHI